MKEKKTGESFGLIDSVMIFLNQHQRFANVWLPVLLATATSLACLWLSAQ